MKVNKTQANFSTITSKLVIKGNRQGQAMPISRQPELQYGTHTSTFDTIKSLNKENSLSFNSLSKSASKEKFERLDTERSHFSNLSLNASYSQGLYNISNEMSSIGKKSKDNINTNNNYIRLETDGRIMEEFDDRRRNHTESNQSSPNNKVMCNEIKKLDHWDMEHTRKGNLKRRTSEYHEFNPKRLVKQMTNLDIKKLKQKIDEGINILPLAKSEEDVENAIIRQNISVVKNKFNFNIFLNKSTKEHKQEISDLEKYRHIMKEKIVNETFERNILIEISNKFYERKIERNSVSRQLSDLSVKLDRYKTEYFFKCDKLNYEKKEIDKIFSELQESCRKSLQFQTSNSVLHNQGRTTNFVRRGTTDDNLFKIQMEWARLIGQKEKDLKKLEKYYNEKKQEVQARIDELKHRLHNLAEELKNLDSMLKNKIAVNKEYYQRILIKGIDCRTDGLSWCVRKLIELNCFLDYNMFPKFLDHSQVDYLINLGTLQMQASYYRSVLKILKDRQIRLREDDQLTYGNILANLIDEESSKANSNPGMSTKIFFYGDSNFNIEEHVNDDTQMISGNVFSRKIMNNFQNIFKKYSQLMRYTFQNKLEEIATFRIVKDFKTKIKNQQIKASKKLTGEQIFKNVISKYLEEIPDKGYFEDILELRKACKAIEEDIQELIRQQKVRFEIQYESTKFTNTNKTINYDLIFKALFGNGITL